jgi:zinc protease
VPIDSLKTFYHKYYRPDNIVLIVCGKFDQAKAISYVSEFFGPLKNPPQPLPKTYTEEPPQDGERTVILRRTGKVALVGVLYHTSAAVQEDNSALEVLSMVLAMPPSGRLNKALVDTKKATEVSANNYNLHDPSVLELTAQVGDQAAAETVRDVMIEVVENLKRNPVTQAEVDRAVKQYLSFREQSLADSKRVGLELSDWVGAGDWRLIFVFRDRLAKVTADDVNRVAAFYLKQSNRTVGMFLPEKTPDRTAVPETPSVELAVKDYKGGKALDQGEAFDPTPENIEKKVRRLKLTSGLKVAILPKKTRGQSNIGTLVLHFGNEKSLKDLTTACSFLGPLMRRGTAKHSRQQIEDLLDQYSSSLSVSSATGRLTLTWKSKYDQVGNVLDLMEEILRRPAFPEKEFDELRRSDRQSLEQDLLDPGALAENVLARKISPHPNTDIRYQPTLQEQIDRLDKTALADVVRIYKEQVGGQTGELVLIGDFDVDITVKRLEKIFGGWKTEVPYERITQTAVKVPGGTENILTPDKKDATYLAALTFPAKDSARDYPALVLGNYLFGGSFSSRLVDKVRQEDGLSYGVASHLSADAQDDYTRFKFSANCNPENINKLDKAALGELATLLDKGITQQELDAGKKAYLAARKVVRGDDLALANGLISGLRLNRTYEYQAEFEKKIAALTVADVNQALRAHLQVGRLVIVRAGDFNKNQSPKK